MTGRAVWDAGILDYLRNNRVQDDAGEYSEVPALQKYITENKYYGIILSGISYDCGTLEGLKFANSNFFSENIKKYSAVLICNPKKFTSIV